MRYKRESPYNRIKDEHKKKIELHLKEIEKLKNGNTDERENGAL